MENHASVTDLLHASARLYVNSSGLRRVISLRQHFTNAVYQLLPGLPRGKALSFPTYGMYSAMRLITSDLSIRKPADARV